VEQATGLVARKQILMGCIMAAVTLYGKFEQDFLYEYEPEKDAYRFSKFIKNG
jgi:hypothetical protein